MKKHLLTFTILLAGLAMSAQQAVFTQKDGKIVETITIVNSYAKDSVVKAITESIKYATDKSKECTDYHSAVIADLLKRKEEIEKVK